MISKQGSQLLVPNPTMSRIPEIMVCRILTLVWSLGPLATTVDERPVPSPNFS